MIPPEDSYLLLYELSKGRKPYQPSSKWGIGEFVKDDFLDQKKEFVCNEFLHPKREARQFNTPSSN